MSRGVAQSFSRCRCLEGLRRAVPGHPSTVNDSTLEEPTMKPMMKWKLAAIVAVALGLAGTTWGFAQQRQSQRFYELRTYTASPDRMDKLLTRFRNHTMRMFEKHGMTNVGYWTATNGENAERTLIYVLAYPSQEKRETSWKAFSADPEWQKVVKESQADGVRLAEKVESRYMKPTDFSPMK